MKRIVFLRHGESIWNKENKFTGWTDVPLTSKGKKEAVQAGMLLKANGFVFDIAFTSSLKRAISTLNLTLEEMEAEWVPVVKSWRLNERHYGALQGLDKDKAREEFGDDQVLEWRRSYATTPPLLKKGDERSPKDDVAYRRVESSKLPLGESLENTVSRVAPVLREVIEPSLLEGMEVLVVAHGNSIRALIKYLEGLTDEEIVGLDIPTGQPLVYELEDDLTHKNHYYLKT
ncbi:2,3-bisphosphoglycerate-dependent phosphoglycerate mutase [Fulvitalea axinellae]|uniref:2,3-bisphosphoglycerate-dependent phosphoglycerate mutase n=1 Tax=Fulvitalea axinellae TaxID=1182444 RepID=A0AAU9CMS1_9BACT|nr:2,3-bisphosphoglycerate-dependent phosphoglycerate mutase [Fulvitalea axinellae]